MRGWNWYRLAVWALALVFVIYMIAIPTGGWIYEQMNPPESGMEIEEMSILEKVRLRTMEAMAALWFIALGATVGSFLNVVAYRLPRGESVAFKRSRCPKCETQIKGRDNMPIFGWLLLGGRCRSCDLPISIRYPIVETIAAAMFFVLFLVELISGGANLPVRPPNFYRGVVWIIFYTKWDLIGFYLYHGFIMSTLLACVLIDFDRQRIPVRAMWLIGAMIFIPTMTWPDLLPVPCFQGIADKIQQPWLMSGLTSLIGGAVGAGLGWITASGMATSKASIQRGESQCIVSVCLAVVGLSLGWQASVAVVLFTLLIRLASASVATACQLPIPRTPGVLLTAFVAHHALWRWTIEHGAEWWPSHQTSSLGWVAVAIGYTTLVLANRLLIRQPKDIQPSTTSIDETDAPKTNNDGDTRLES